MTHGRCLLLLTVVFALVATSGAVAGERGDLTPEAIAAVKTLYPNADIVGVTHEKERGVSYFEVAVREGGRRTEIEVTADGTIGEVEREVSVAEAPAAVREGIDGLTRGATPKVERKEIHGVARHGAFEALDAPVVAYEVEYEAQGRRVEVTLDENGSPLALGGKGDDASGDDSSDSSDADSSDDSGSDDSDSDDSDSEG